jgi:MFS family permease
MGRCAVLGVLGYLAAVIAEHAIDPSLDPATHQVSEYVHGPAGALMTAGFVAWVISLGASGMLASLRLRARWVSVALRLAAIGMLITACFGTQTIAGRLPPGVSLTWSGRLHDIGSGATTVALFAAALLSLRAIRERQFRRRTSALLIFAICCDIALLAVGSEVGGVRERLLILAGCVWQLMFLSTMRPFGGQRRHRPTRK